MTKLKPAAGGRGERCPPVSVSGMPSSSAARPWVQTAAGELLRLAGDLAWQTGLTPLLRSLGTEEENRTFKAGNKIRRMSKAWSEAGNMTKSL